MLSHVRATKEMALIKSLYSMNGYQCRWMQLVSKEGRICGIGSFTQRRTTHTKSGNWSKTLQNRINARHEKGKDWGDY